jgi:hypothetical protein
MSNACKAYGNTPKTLLKVTIIGLIMAAVVYAIFMIAAVAQGGAGAIRHVFTWPVVAIPAGVGLILPLVVLPTTLSNIRIEGRTVRHLFMNRWTLGTGSIDDLTEIDLGRGLFAVVLRFRDGRRIRLLGAPVACSPKTDRGPARPVVRHNYGRGVVGLSGGRSSKEKPGAGRMCLTAWPRCGGKRRSGQAHPPDPERGKAERRTYATPTALAPQVKKRDWHNPYVLRCRPPRMLTALRGTITTQAFEGHRIRQEGAI